MKTQIRLFVLLMFIPWLFAGCWDFEEADQRGFVTTIGIDPGPSKGVILSVQIPKPQKMLPPGTQGGLSEGKTFNTISVSANTVNDALNVLQTKTYRNLVVQQNKSIIVNPKAIRSGMTPLLEFLTRNPKSPPQALIFITKGISAKELLSATPTQTTLPGLMFVQSAQSIVKYDRTYFIPIWLFRQKLDHPTKDAYAPLIGFDRLEGQYIESGLAVFNDDRLAGELNPRETQMFGIVSGQIHEGGLTVLFPSGNITLRNLKGRTKIRVALHDGTPFFSVKVKVRGKISEITGKEYKTVLPRDVSRFEQIIEKALQPELTAVIRKLQRYNSDIIDFGEELRVQRQTVWDRIHWKQAFPSVDFKVRVEVKIEGNGVLQ